MDQRKRRCFPSGDPCVEFASFARYNLLCTIRKPLLSLFGIFFLLLLSHILQSWTSKWATRICFQKLLPYSRTALTMYQKLWIFMRNSSHDARVQLCQNFVESNSAFLGPRGDIQTYLFIYYQLKRSRIPSSSTQLCKYDLFPDFFQPTCDSLFNKWRFLKLHGSCTKFIQCHEWYVGVTTGFRKI